MYVNKCTKCGAEFETKNPKRIICPNCLYPDKKPMGEGGSFDNPSGERQQNEERPQQRSSYSYEGNGENERPYPPRNYNAQRGYQNNRQQGDYQNRQYQPREGGYNRPQGGYNRQQGGYNRPQGQGGYNRPQGQGGYNSGYNNRPQRQGGFNRPQRSGGQGGFNRPQQRRPHGGPQRGPRAPRELLVNREQLAQIEVLYKRMLPLPNPDAHEVIGAEIGLEPRKVFFGINLVRQKMFLPKLPFPKRKLAVSADQLTAIKNLYEPLLPIPPIGCHKIIASQLKMDEWRVHVGIGLVRKQMGLDRWNEGRPDAPPPIDRPRKGMAPFNVKKAEETETPVAETEAEAPKKAGRKKKTEEETTEQE